jgi:hypothetical protein
MTDDGMMRASDADREVVVSALRDAYAAGRLTLEELHERTSAAYAGRTWGGLRELTSDLPERPHLGGPGTSPEPAEHGAAEHGAAESGSAEPGAEPSTQAGPPGPVRRRRPVGAVMPFVMAWFLIMLATRSAGAIAVPVVVIVLFLLFTGMSRRK